MDACLITIIVIVILFFIGFILLIKIGRRTKFLCSVSNSNAFTYRQEIINKLKDRGYLIKEKQNGDIFVQKDNFSATTLVLKQNGPNVDVSFIHSNSNALLAAFIISFIFIWIFAIALALIADSKSEKFRLNELLPIIKGHGLFDGRCPNCGRLIPGDARICPYCAKSFN